MRRLIWQMGTIGGILSIRLLGDLVPLQREIERVCEEDFSEKVDCKEKHTMEVGSFLGGWRDLMHSLTHWPDHCHTLCSRWNARHGAENEQGTITLLQDHFSRHSVVVWSSEWLGRWATIQLLKRRTWPAQPKPAGIQGRISFSEGSNGTRQETKTNIQPQTKQTQWSRGARL